MREWTHGRKAGPRRPTHATPACSSRRRSPGNERLTGLPRVQAIRAWSEAPREAYGTRAMACGGGRAAFRCVEGGRRGSFATEPRRWTARFPKERLFADPIIEDGATAKMDPQDHRDPMLNGALTPCIQ
jgi:hypothetical protein